MKLQKTSEYLFAESLDIESLAWNTGFYQREPKKITASSLFSSFWQMQQKGKNTLRNWCLCIGEQIGDTVAKQSLNERLDEKSVDLCEAVLKKPCPCKWIAQG